MTTIISSQIDLIEDRVEAHMNDNEFTVLLSPEFEIDGETYQVVLDGHHRLEAASRNGVEPTFEIATTQECDAISLLENGQTEDFLNSVYIDTSWYDISSGITIW